MMVIVYREGVRDNVYNSSQRDRIASESQRGHGQCQRTDGSTISRFVSAEREK